MTRPNSIGATRNTALAKGSRLKVNCIRKKAGSSRRSVSARAPATPPALEKRPLRFQRSQSANRRESTPQPCRLETGLYQG